VSFRETFPAFQRPRDPSANKLLVNSAANFIILGIMQAGQTIPSQINAHVRQPLRGRSHVAKGKSMPRRARSRPAFRYGGETAPPYLQLRASPSRPSYVLRRPPLTHLRRRHAIKSSSKGVNRGEPMAFSNASPSQRFPRDPGSREKGTDPEEGKNSKGLRCGSPAGDGPAPGVYTGCVPRFILPGLSWPARGIG